MKKLHIIFLFILCLASKMFAAEATDSGDLSGLLTGGNDYQATSYGKCRKVRNYVANAQDFFAEFS